MSAPMPTAMGINRIRAAKGGSAFPTVMPCLARSAERTDCLCYEAGRGPGQYYRNTGIDTVRLHRSDTGNEREATGPFGLIKNISPNAPALRATGCRRS